ncbi:uncharacterized protein LOC110445784 [Mizuhopecten yessoensis]|uniref:Uncharacterized protein n=1 Tax=Mizuhopecten yessoensis TaxID=6573 RepID=A0A210R6C0_MIZYE|nr:uncharacterized protein LOC110445784 [Mizuhopecten yessoensis]OWF56597.1 hypothetical protein KP79_PYT00041 [Mizuhopecten yessoensis]
MAEAVAEQINSPKISCCSRNSAVKINECVQTKIDKTICDYETLNEDQKSTTKARFDEVFQSAFTLNLEIGGQSWTNNGNAGDCTSEYQPLDKTKKLFITDTLSTKLDDGIVRVAHNRKTTGKKFKYKMKKVIAAEIEYMSQIRVVNVDNEPYQSDFCVYSTVTCNRLLEADTTLLDLTKTTTTLIQQFSNLEKAVEINESRKTCKTDQIIFKPSSDEGKMAKSITPLKRKLSDSQDIFPAKRQNSSWLANAPSPFQSLNRTQNVTVEKRCSPRLAAKNTDHRTRLKS